MGMKLMSRTTSKPKLPTMPAFTPERVVVRASRPSLPVELCSLSPGGRWLRIVVVGTASHSPLRPYPVPGVRGLNSVLLQNRQDYSTKAVRHIIYSCLLLLLRSARHTFSGVMGMSST
jgi:hypothetical protein